MFPLPLNMYFEVAALLTAALLWRSLRNTRLRWFVPFLILIVVAEFTGRYLNRELRHPNAWLYNFVVPIEYIFFALLFYWHYRQNINKTIALFFIAAFAAYALIIYVVNGVYNFNSDFLLYGSFSIVTLAILYFIEYYLYPEETIIWQTPMFWIAFGILLFNIGEFTYNLLSKYFIDNLMDEKLRLFRSINSKLILVLYSCFIIAFLCQRTTKTFKTA
jgi:hypothetical protein